MNLDLGKCYYLIDSAFTWNEANDFCKALELGDSVATLTSVRSKEENLYVWSLIPSFSPGAWIGGSDEAEESIWRWVNLKILVSVLSALHDHQLDFMVGEGRHG